MLTDIPHVFWLDQSDKYQNVYSIVDDWRAEEGVQCFRMWGGLAIVKVGTKLKDKKLQQRFERALAKGVDAGNAPIETGKLYELCATENCGAIGKQLDSLWPHDAHVEGVPLSFEDLREYFALRTTHYGYIWKHPDGRVAKVKRDCF